MTDSSLKWSWASVATGVFALGAGGVGGYFGQPLIHKNDLAINVIVTAFSILAGFLIAIMTIMGDPSAFGRTTWRAHELSRKSVFRGLQRQHWLFSLYLATVCAMFAGSLLSRTCEGTAACSKAITWLERAYLFMAIVAFVISFRLPGTLMRIQMARHDLLIDSRRRSPTGGPPASPVPPERSDPG